MDIIDGSDQRRIAIGEMRRRIYLVQIILTLPLLIIYQLSGASSNLARGLETLFGGAWWWVNAVYLLVSVIGYAVILFPLSYYSGYVLERSHEAGGLSLRRWWARYLRGLLLDGAGITIFFSIVYMLIRYTPNTWWIGASLSFIVLVILLGMTAPSMITAFFPSARPIQDCKLKECLSAFIRRLDRRIQEISVWNYSFRPSMNPVVISGWGRTRRMVFTPEAIATYPSEELTALAAREIGHIRMRTGWRILGVGTALSLGGFYLVHHYLTVAIRRLPDAYFRSIADISGFPLFLFGLLLFVILVLPLLHAHARHLEYVADRYAVKIMGTAEQLVRALKRQDTKAAALSYPLTWTEWLFCRLPSLEQRINNARETARINRR